MSAALLVRKAGAQALVQDLGRPGWRDLGVPVGGAADRRLLRLGNRLLGNDEGLAAIEFRLAGPTLEAQRAPVRVALCGHVGGRLSHDGGAPVALPPWRTVRLQPGESLAVGAVEAGAVGYLVVEGGVQVAPQMGGRGTYLRAGFGGFEGRALAVGDRVPVQPAGDGPERRLARAPERESGPLRVVPGPQDDYFDAATMGVLLGERFVVSQSADRMGIRLQGPSLPHRPERGADLVSDGLVPGAIQVPGDGQPILLFVDCQTVGGYPKIACVIGADVDRIGQLCAGDTVRFEAVSIEQAERIAAAREAALLALSDGIEAAVPLDGLDVEALYSANLVGGAVDGRAATHFPGHLEDPEP